MHSRSWKGSRARTSSAVAAIISSPSVLASGIDSRAVSVSSVSGSVKPEPSGGRLPTRASRRAGGPRSARRACLSVLPLRPCSPASAYATAASEARFVASPTRTFPVSAADWIRAAVLTRSPATMPCPSAPSVTRLTRQRRPALAAELDARSIRRATEGQATRSGLPHSPQNFASCLVGGPQAGTKRCRAQANSSEHAAASLDRAAAPGPAGRRRDRQARSSRSSPAAWPMRSKARALRRAAARPRRCVRTRRATAVVEQHRREPVRVPEASRVRERDPPRCARRRRPRHRVEHAAPRAALGSERLRWRSTGSGSLRASAAGLRARRRSVAPAEVPSRPSAMHWRQHRVELGQADARRRSASARSESARARRRWRHGDACASGSCSIESSRVGGARSSLACPVTAVDRDRGRPSTCDWIGVRMRPRSRIVSPDGDCLVPATEQRYLDEVRGEAHLPEAVAAPTRERRAPRS